MDSYYDEILKKIKDLMDEGKYAEANKLLEEELAMPYIPFNVEEELIQCYNECRSELRAHTQKAYSEDDIEAVSYTHLSSTGFLGNSSKKGTRFKKIR